jgi:hypothetical protein
MIFGFNTDVRHGDTVYHVQSEAKEDGRVLQTQFFVGGQCVGKRTIPVYGAAVEDEIHDLLKQQHRDAVEAAREGRIAELIGEMRECDTETPLAMEWTNPTSFYSGNTVVMRFRISRAGEPVIGARVFARMHMMSLDEDPVYALTVSDEHGAAQIEVAVDESRLNESAVLVQACLGDVCITRKFRLYRGQ